MISRKCPSSLLICLWRLQANTARHCSYYASTTASCSSFHSCVEQTRRCSNQANPQRNSSAAAEKFEFHAEVKSLLDIVAKSLYSDQEVFIRELISNASDAVEKRRCVELGQGHVDSTYEIRISIDEAAKKICFVDTGIGMSRQELIDLLGTIAKSGSKSFREENTTNQSAESIIGQFGVGFYSALSVSDKVIVHTKKLGESTSYTWTWDGASGYEITENADLEVGTQIELYIRSGSERFLQSKTVEDVVNKYSSFVTVPIIVNGRLVNTMKALWMMNANETTPEMHHSFFKQIAKTHYPTLVNDRPKYTIQYKTDSPHNIRALLYVPSQRAMPQELRNPGLQETGVSLYNRKVLIKSQAKEVLPNYLRFLVGVVDSEDIPLNLSREMLQTDLILDKIRRTLTDKIIKFFVNQLNKDRIQYSEFYKSYHLFFKEGIIMEKEQQVKEDISKLLLFESSNFKPGTLTSLQEYVDRMQTDQNSIYFLYSPSRQLAESSPYFEIFKQRNLEVIFIYEPIDEVVFLAMPQFQMKRVKSVEEWIKSQGLDSDPQQKELTRDVSKQDFIGWVKSSLGSVKATEVKPSGRQSEHPFMLTISTDMSAARYLLHTADIKEMEHLVLLKPVVHVNFSHPVVKGLLKLSKQNPELAKKVTEQVYDNALVTAGLLKDSSQMVGRINQILGDLMQEEKSPILTP